MGRGCALPAPVLSPAQFHMQLQCPLSMAAALMDQSHPTRAVSSPQLQPQTHSHPYVTAGPCGQAAPPGTGGEAGLRKAEDGGADM